jgi:hypothetical protein
MLTVGKSGVEDFMVIQDAVNAAASGDTILVGPGEYFETSEFQLDCCQSDSTHIGITQPSLTILGTARDDVLIGPTVPAGGVVIAMQRSSALNLTLRNVTLRNRSIGLRLFEQSVVENVKFESCWTGIWTIPESANISNCVFENCSDVGIAALSGGTNILIDECTFLDNVVGVDMFDSRDMIISRSNFSGGRAAINVGNFSNPVIRNCTTRAHEVYGILLVHDSEASLYDNTVEGDFAALFLLASANAVAYRNEFVGGTNSAVRFKTDCSVEFRENTFSPASSSYAIVLDTYPVDPNCEILDLSGNYWTTTEPDSIAELIWDGDDDPGNHAVVQYEPFLDGPVPVRHSTLGQLKAQFRGNR